MLGLTGGVKNLPWLFSATFIVMLLAVPIYGWLCSRFSRRVFLPWVYGFFIGNILIFYAVFSIDPQNIWAARAFFVWLSVFNLFIVSVFWSLLADIFTPEQAHRLFGFIAAGGSMGAIIGPLLTTSLVHFLGTTQLLLVSASLLALTRIFIRQLLDWQQHINKNPTTIKQHSELPLGGSIFSGLSLVAKSPYLLGISGFILLASINGTFLYFQQADYIARYVPDKTQQTQLFASIDLAVNSLSIVIQLFFTRRLMVYLGTAKVLAFVPMLMVLAFMGLSVYPTLPILFVAMIVRRTGEYALLRPAREMLFTSVNQTTKYTAKNVIDTVVFRGGDALSGWLYAPIALLGTFWIGVIAAFLAAIWSRLGYCLGNRHDQNTLNPHPTNSPIRPK